MNHAIMANHMISLITSSTTDPLLLLMSYTELEYDMIYMYTVVTKIIPHIVTLVYSNSSCYINYTCVSGGDPKMFVSMTSTK